MVRRWAVACRSGALGELHEALVVKWGRLCKERGRKRRLPWRLRTGPAAVVFDGPGVGVAPEPAL
eukprot:2786403-Alexandrium_andersonii.AAC.1